MSETTSEVAVRVESSPAQLIEMAVQQGADPANLEKLMDLQERWEAKQAKQKFDAAFAQFQFDCPPIVKQKDVNMGGGGYSYAPYEDIMHAIRQPLANNGLSLSFDSEMLEGGLLLTTCRVSGHGYSERSSVTLPVPSQMRVNDTQKAGAGLSYGKRYALINALNLSVVGEDSDAARMSEKSIDDSQFDILTDMLESADANVSGTKDRFLAWLEKATGAVVLRELPSKHYAMVHEMLRGKLKAGVK